MSHLATDHQNNMLTTLEWVYKKWATLQDEYSQIPNQLRQYYVDELAKAMADWSVCGFKIEGDDNLNVDTVWLHLFTDTLPKEQITDGFIAEISQRIDLPIWSSVKIYRDGLSIVSFAFVPKRTPKLTTRSRRHYGQELTFSLFPPGRVAGTFCCD